MKNEISKALFESILFEDDVCRYPYGIRETKYRNYKLLLAELSRLKEQGICDYSFDPLNKALTLHCIYINWAPENDYWELDPTVVARLLSLCDGLLINSDDGHWQLSSQIYFEK